MCLDNVATDGFDVRVQRPRNRTTAITSTVYCLIVEEGAHTLPDGRAFEAHTVTSYATNGRTPG